MSPCTSHAALCAKFNKRAGCGNRTVTSSALRQAAETLGALEPAGLPAPDRLEGVAIINGAVLNFMRAELANIDEVIDCVVSPSITGRLW